MRIFSTKLKKLRLKLNISAKKLGDAIGVSDATINRWENGVMSPKAEYIVALCDFFNVSADYLLGRVD